MERVEREAEEEEGGWVEEEEEEGWWVEEEEEEEEEEDLEMRSGAEALRLRCLFGWVGGRKRMSTGT